MPETPRARWFLTGLVALAIGCGVFFRFFGLGEKLLWHDEVSTRILASGHLHDEWKTTLYTARVFDVSEVVRYQHDNPQRGVLPTIAGLAQDDPQHPPLYYVLARVWIGLVGNDIGALRVLSALLSLLCFPAMFWLCRELFGSRRIGWAAVAIAAASPLFILYAQEAREYALWTVLIVLSNAALLRAIRCTEEQPAFTRRAALAWATYGLCTVLALYTSFSTTTLILAQLALLVIRERGRIRTIAKASATTLTVAALLFLPWALNLLRNYEAFRISMNWSEVIVIPRTELLRILGTNISRMTTDFWREPRTALAWVAVGLTLALVTAALAYTVRGGTRETKLLLLASIAAPLGTLLLPDLLFGGIRSVSARYLMPCWVVAQVALANLLVREGRSRRATGLGLAGLTVLLATSLGSAYSNSREVAGWTKGISVELPAVAEAINAAPRPLLVGNMEQYHPGNLMALSNRLKPGTRMQFLRPEMEEGYMLPPDPGDVFLMSPTIQFRQGLERREHVRTRLVLEDIHLQLWAVDRAE